MEKNTKSLSIVVVGWHFKHLEIYRELQNEARLYNSLKVNFYIASHKEQNGVKGPVVNELETSGWNILYFENKGWDWGAYQQLLTWQSRNSSLSDFYLFLHDDIKIKNKGFIGKFIEEIQNGARAVGNGLPHPQSPDKLDVSEGEEWKKIAPHVFYWAKLGGFPIKSQRWKCIRGSCLFTTKEVSEKVLLRMPIKNGHHLGFGNWNLKIFAGGLKDLYGGNVVRYLGNEVQNSFYIEEETRGGAHGPGLKKVLRKKVSLHTPEALKRVIRRVTRGQKAPVVPMGLKLNLGCGSRYVEGYLNIDAESEIADLKTGLLDMDFEKGSICVVLMIDPFKSVDFSEFLSKIYSWLNKDGQLSLEFSDITKPAGDIPEVQNKGRFVLDKKVSSAVFQKRGWLTKMRSLLKDAGFRTIYIERPQISKSNRKGIRLTAIK